MAKQINYTLPNGDIIENAYLRVQKIITSNQDFEFLKPSDKENVESETEWITRFESEAVIYVWTDKMARDYRVTPIHWFNLKFDFDKASERNIYQQVYDLIEGENV